eukprot:5149541-Amphidinium_carterae.1
MALQSVYAFACFQPEDTAASVQMAASGAAAPPLAGNRPRLCATPCAIPGTPIELDASLGNSASKSICFCSYPPPAAAYPPPGGFTCAKVLS